MSGVYTLAISGTILALVALFLAFYLFKKSRPKPIENFPTIPTFEELVKLSKSSSNISELKNAVEIVSNHYKFSGKDIELEFVYNISRNKSSDAKLIVYMDKVLKKANPEFKSKIELTQNLGMSDRNKS